MSHNPASAPDLAARIIDYKNGTTALHQAAKEGTLKDICGVTAELLATIKDYDGWTPLHHAAWHGHLDQIPEVTAAFLATVKTDYGWTPLEHYKNVLGGANSEHHGGAKSVHHCYCRVQLTDQR